MKAKKTINLLVALSIFAQSNLFAIKFQKPKKQLNQLEKIAQKKYNNNKKLTTVAIGATGTLSLLFTTIFALRGTISNKTNSSSNMSKNKNMPTQLPAKSLFSTIKTNGLYAGSGITLLLLLFFLYKILNKYKNEAQKPNKINQNIQTNETINDLEDLLKKNKSLENEKCDLFEKHKKIQIRHENKIKELTSRTQELDKQQNNTQAQITTHEQTIKHLQALAADKEAEIKQQEQEKQDLSQKLNQQNSDNLTQITKYEQTIKHLNAQAIKNANVIQASLEKQKNFQNILENTMQDQCNIIKELQTKIRNKEAKIKKKKKIIAQHGPKINVLNEKNKKQNLEIHELNKKMVLLETESNQKLQEIKKLKEHINANIITAKKEYTKTLTRTASNDSLMQYTDDIIENDSEFHTPESTSDEDIRYTSDNTSSEEESENEFDSPKSSLRKNNIFK